MSNSEPSAIVLQGIPCMRGLYKFRFEWRKRFAQLLDALDAPYPRSQAGAQETAIRRLVCQPPDGPEPEVDRPWGEMARFQAHPGTDDNRLAERPSRLRAVPVHEFINGMTIAALSVRAGETVENGGFGWTLRYRLAAWVRVAGYSPEDAADLAKVVKSQELPAMTPGDSIAHYRITSKLGEGGMGEVYRAHRYEARPRCGDQGAAGSVRTRSRAPGRFQREAKVLASLNHPNIATIYGLEDRARHPGDGAGGGPDARRAHREAGRCRSTKRCRSRGRSRGAGVRRTRRASSIAT